MHRGRGNAGAADTGPQKISRSLEARRRQLREGAGAGKKKEPQMNADERGYAECPVGADHWLRLYRRQ
jgi:hypothetical protein